MIKLFKVPVVVTKEDFPDITYKAEGVADYWDVHSAEHENLEDALNDIKKQLQKKYQHDADTWGEVEIEKDDDIDLDENQKLFTIEIEINMPNEDEDF